MKQFIGFCECGKPLYSKTIDYEWDFIPLWFKIWYGILFIPKAFKRAFETARAYQKFCDVLNGAIKNKQVE